MRQFRCDPLTLFGFMWPTVRLYDKQREMILATRDAKETYVVAGNKLGKDFIAGPICWMHFLAPQVFYPSSYVRQVERMNRHSANDPEWMVHQRRVITTSVKDEHLDVLWSEIDKFYRLCKLDLSQYVTILHHEIRFKEEGEKEGKNVLSYLKGMTSKTGEGISGHHAAYTLGVGDEASGLDNEVHNQMSRWAHRMFFFGNPNPTNNFFKKNYRKGDLLMGSKA